MRMISTQIRWHDLCRSLCKLWEHRLDFIKENVRELASPPVPFMWDFRSLSKEFDSYFLIWIFHFSLPRFSYYSWKKENTDTDNIMQWQTPLMNSLLLTKIFVLIIWICFLNELIKPLLDPAEYGFIVTIHKHDRIYSQKGTSERKYIQLSPEGEMNIGGYTVYI